MSERGPSKATRAVEYAENAGAEFWHDADGDAYTDIRGEDGVRQTIRVRTRSFRTWLSGVFYEADGGALGGQSATDAVDVVAAKAVYGGPERDVYVRIAGGPDGEIYFDLGDDSWTAVRVTSTGWDFVSKPPVRFRRPRGLRPLPRPVRDGQLDDLRSLLNLATDRDWILTLAWLLGTMRPDGPYPVLALTGEAGSAKTSLGKVLRYLVDPNAAPLRGPPREGRDLVIAASNSHIVAFDNLSSLRDWLSDALCRVATGDGFATRELYSDREEVIFEGARPILLTGIEDVIARGDLADRTIPLALLQIPDQDRRTEADLWAEVDLIRPGVLGALLDAVVVGLSRLPSVELSRLPRMADFARWIVACEPALSWTAGEFMKAYHDARDDMVETGIEADPVATAVIAMIGDMTRSGHNMWSGTAADLLKTLNGRRADNARPPKEWPKTPRAMSGALARAAPLLRAVGIGLTRVRTEDSERKRMIELNWQKDASDRPDRPADDPDSAAASDGSDGSAPSRTTVCATSTTEPDLDGLLQVTP